MRIDKLILGSALILGSLLSACTGAQIAGAASEEPAKELVSDVRNEKTDASATAGTVTVLAKRAAVQSAR